MEWTISNIARLFGTTEQAVGRLVAEAGLPVHVVNEQFRFNRAELLEWATANRVNVASELLTEPESSAGSLPGLADALRSGGVHYRVGGGDRGSVLRAVVGVMPLPREVNRDHLLQVLARGSRRRRSATGSPSRTRAARSCFTSASRDRAVLPRAAGGLRRPRRQAGARAVLARQPERARPPAPALAQPPTACATAVPRSSSSATPAATKSSPRRRRSTYACPAPGSRQGVTLLLAGVRA